MSQNTPQTQTDQPDPVGTVLKVLAMFDYISPLVGLVQAELLDYCAVVVPALDNMSGLQLGLYLRHYGVRIYAPMVVGNWWVFNVKEAQVRYALYLLGRIYGQENMYYRPRDRKGLGIARVPSPARLRPATA